MAYEVQAIWPKGSKGPDGDMGPVGKKGETGGTTTPETPEIDPPLIRTGSITFTTEPGGGEVVGDGTITMFGGGLKPTIIISATLPTDDPPTVENDGEHKRYYAKLPDNFGGAYTVGGDRITDDGQAWYSFSIIKRDMMDYLQAMYYGSSGNGIINTMIK